MKKIAFIFIFAVSCLGSSLAFAGAQAGSGASAKNTKAAVENNGSDEKQNMTDSGLAKKAKKHGKLDSKRTDTTKPITSPLTAEEQEWEKAVHNQ